MERPFHVRSVDRIPEPEPAHLSTENDQDDEREATELLQHPNLRSTQARQTDHWYDPLRRFWKNHIRLSVPHVDCRDHLANERTFLGYLRTSMALSIIGCLVAQFWRLQHSPTPSPIFGYFVLSKPLAAILQASALGNVILGTIRYFRQQSAMARGKVYAGGWELFVIMGFSLLLLITLFVLQIGLEIYKDRQP